MRLPVACFAASAFLAACTGPLIADAPATTDTPVLAAAGAAEAGQYTASSAPRMSMKEFKALLDAGGVVVLDVRSLEAYRAGHIRGAISVPLETVAARADEFKTAGKPVVTYCA